MQGVDQEEFTRLWMKSQRIVAGFIASMVPDFHESEDMLQNVAVVLLRKFSEYDSSQSFTGWALGIARYEVLQKRRSASRRIVNFRPEVSDAVAAAFEDMAPELESRTAALRQCFREVKGRSWDLLRLRYEEAMSPAQIGEKLAMESGTVRVSLSRIRASLQGCIERKMKERQA